MSCSDNSFFVQNDPSIVLPCFLLLSIMLWTPANIFSSDLTNHIMRYGLKFYIYLNLLTFYYLKLFYISFLEVHTGNCWLWKNFKFFFCFSTKTLLLAFLVLSIFAHVYLSLFCHCFLFWVCVQPLLFKAILNWKKSK